MESPHTPNPPEPYDTPAQAATFKPTGMTDAAYRKNRRKTHKPMNFEIEKDRREQLKAVSKKRGVSMGATLRQLITAAYTMEIKNRPSCVDGRACFVPHMHPKPDETETHGDSSA